MTTATPVQRALCRTVDGGDLGDLATHPDVVDAFGGTVPTQEARELVLLGGIRGAKSLLSAAAAVRCSQRVRLDGAELKDSDVPRVSICSIDIDKARVVLNDHLLGALERSPFLRAIYMGRAQGGEGIILRHPSGRPVEVSVVAGKRAGNHLVSRWAAGVIFDEAARMTGANEGLINLSASRTSVYGRLLPGAMLLEPGSPWGPFGPIHELYVEHFGKPTRATVVARCPGWVMNPAWWTPERCEQLRASNPDAYMTDVECHFLAPVASLFSSVVLERACCLPDEDQPRDMRASYVACMDPGTRGNAWTLVVATRDGDVKRTVCHREWRGSSAKPLSPREVLKECADILRSYGLDWCFTDQWYIDANQDLASDESLSLVQYPMDSAERTRRYMQLRAMLVEGTVELHANAQLRSDLQRVERHATAGGITIQLPKTTDGRHCDYAPAVVVAVTHPLDDVLPEMDLETRLRLEARERRLATEDADTKAMREGVEKRFARKGRR